MMRRIEVSLIVGSALALGACNGSNLGGGQSKGHITQQNSGVVAQKLSASVVSSMLGRAGMPAGSGAMKGASVAHFSPGDCWTMTGDQTDTDGDGVPDSVSVTYTNCSDTFDGWTETYSGSETFGDPTADTADYAYTDAYDLTASVTDGTDSEDDHFTGSDSFGQTCGGFGDDASFHDDYSGTYQGQAYSGTESENWAENYSATDRTWTPDQPLAAGTYSVNGDWSDTIDGQAVSANIATTDPLIVDPSCDSLFTGGTITANDSDGSSETITWTACDQYTDTYTAPAGS